MREFLALPLPEEVRRAGGAVAARLAEIEGWRATREEGLHVTLRFLGEVDPARHRALGASWRAAAEGTGPLRLRLGGFLFLPSPARARVCAIVLVDETPGEALAALADRVERAARVLGFKTEPRPFAPHVTVARARPAVRASMPPPAVGGNALDFVADRLVLFSSELKPGGSLYAELESYPFGPAARG